MKYTPEQIDEWFREFHAVYPRRKGANPQALAFKRFVKALKNGHDPHLIIAAAVAYSLESMSLGLDYSPHIKMAATWLNQERFLS